jgi:hypothetical protein
MAFHSVAISGKEAQASLNNSPSPSAPAAQWNNPVEVTPQFNCSYGAAQGKVGNIEASPGPAVARGNLGTSVNSESGVSVAVTPGIDGGIVHVVGIVVGSVNVT